MQTSSLGSRLREERERLGLKQDALGQLGGVNRNTQGNYEKGDRLPDAGYLINVAQVGVDVLYVLTGGRTPQPMEGVTAEEEELLRNLRMIPALDRAVVQRTAAAFAELRRADLVPRSDPVQGPN